MYQINVYPPNCRTYRGYKWQIYVDVLCEEMFIAASLILVYKRESPLPYHHHHIETNDAQDRMV